MKKDTNKGITLIAIVITIVIMLILSSVSINLFIKDDGLMQNSAYSNFVFEYSQVDEAVRIYTIFNKNFIENQRELYPTIGDRITQIEFTLLDTIEQNRKEEVEIEDLNLYMIDLAKIEIQNKSTYVIDVDTGTVYLLKGIKIGEYIYHIPNIKTIEKNESEVVKYVISFDSNYENGEIITIEREENTQYGELPTPTRTGYTFEGWYTEQAGGEQITSDSIVKITNNQTLYAQWKANTYTISLNENGGSDVDDANVTYDQKYINLPTPKRDGHAFAGWYTEPCKGIIINDSVTVTEPVYSTLYARWQKTNIEDDFSSNATEVAVFQTGDENGDGLADFINYQLKCTSSHEKMNIPLTNLIIGKTYTLKFTTCTNATINSTSVDSIKWRYGCYISNEKNTSIANNALDIIINTANTGHNNWRCTEEQIDKINTVTLVFTANANTMYWIWEYGAIKDGFLYQYELQNIELNRVDNEVIDFGNYTRLPTTSNATYEVIEKSKWSTKYNFTGASGCERIAYKITGLVSGKTYTLSFTEDYIGRWVEGATVSYEYGCVVLDQEQYSTFLSSPGGHTFLENYENSCVIMRSSEGQFKEKISGTLNASFVASGTTAYWVWDYSALSDSVKSTIFMKVTNFTVSDGKVSNNIDITE